MKTELILYFVSGMLILISGCAGHEAKTIKTVNDIFKLLNEPKRNLTEVAASAKNINHSYISEENLKEYSDGTLNLLYEALSRITFLFPEDKEYLTMQEKVLEEKLSRQEYNEYDIEDMYKAYLGDRMFEKAINIRKRFPNIELPSMPEMIVSDNPPGGTQWRVYDVPDDGKTAELKVLPIEKGTKVIMLMLPGCSVSENAMTQIMEDADLSQVFKKYGIVITKTFNAESIALWKNQFNFHKIYIANKASDFQGFDFRVSPTFYFLKNGKIVSRFVGWSGSEGKINLRKGLESLSIF